MIDSISTVPHRFTNVQNVLSTIFSKHVPADENILLSSFSLPYFFFSCGVDEPRRPQDALHAAAEAYPLVTETQNDDFSPVVWRVPLIPQQLLTATQDSSRWLKLPPTEKNMVSFDIWTEGETVNPHQRQKATFVKEFQTATNAEFRTTPILCGIKQLNVYGVTDEKSVLLNHNVRIHLPTFIKLPLRFEYEGVEGLPYHLCQRQYFAQRRSHRGASQRRRVGRTAPGTALSFAEDLGRSIQILEGGVRTDRQPKIRSPDRTDSPILTPPFLAPKSIAPSAPS